MNLRELQQKVTDAIESAIEYGDEPANITVSIQVDHRDGKSEWSSDVELHYDNDCQVSGCVLVGDAGEVQP